MPKPFDATTKHLIEMRPSDWLAYVGVAETSARLIDADLATITAEADRVLRVGQSHRGWFTWNSRPAMNATWASVRSSIMCC